MRTLSKFYFSLIDMWEYDLFAQEWEPLRSQSKTLPTPRSDFAHTKINDTFLMFGGKGSSLLLNDMH